MVLRIGLPIGAALACNQIGSRDIKDKKHASYEGGEKENLFIKYNSHYPYRTRWNSLT